MKSNESIICKIFSFLRPTASLGPECPEIVQMDHNRDLGQRLQLPDPPQVEKIHISNYAENNTN